LHHSPLPADKPLQLRHQLSARLGGSQAVAEAEGGPGGQGSGLAELEPSERHCAQRPDWRPWPATRCCGGAEKPEQLRALGAGAAGQGAAGAVALAAEGRGRGRLLLPNRRASLLEWPGKNPLPPQPLEPAALAQLRRSGAPGAVLVASWVRSATALAGGMCVLAAGFWRWKLPVTPGACRALRKGAPRPARKSLRWRGKERDLELDRGPWNLSLGNGELELAQVMANVIAAGRTAGAFHQPGGRLFATTPRNANGWAALWRSDRPPGRPAPRSELSYLNQQRRNHQPDAPELRLDLGHRCGLEGQLLPGLFPHAAAASRSTRLFPALPLAHLSGQPRHQPAPGAKAWRRIAKGSMDLPPLISRQIRSMA